MKKLIIILVFTLFISTACEKSDSSSTETNKIEKNDIMESIITVGYPIHYSFEDQISVSGKIQPIEEVLMTSAIDGRVEDTLAAVGKEVREGQLLAKIDRDRYQLLFKESENQVELARLAYDSALSDYERYKVLYDSESVSKMDFDQIEKSYKMSKINYESAETQKSIAQKNLNDTLIKSKINGVVAEKYITTGENVFPGTQLYKVVNNQNVFVVLKLNEKKINKVVEGMNAQVELSNGELVIGKVASISPLPIEGELNYEVKILVDNSLKHLKLGGFAMVTITSNKSPDRLAIKSKWILQDGDGKFVWINKDNRVERNYIQTGLETENMTEIISGIKESDQIIVTSNNTLNEGDVVKTE